MAGWRLRGGTGLPLIADFPESGEVCLELYNLFFSSEVHHLGRAVHAVTNPVVEHVNMNRLLAHGLKLLGRFCQPDVLRVPPACRV